MFDYDIDRRLQLEPVENHARVLNVTTHLDFPKCVTGVELTICQSPALKVKLIDIERFATTATSLPETVPSIPSNICPLLGRHTGGKVRRFTRWPLKKKIDKPFDDYTHQASQELCHAAGMSSCILDESQS